MKMVANRRSQKGRALNSFGRPGSRRRNDARQLERAAAGSAEELVLGLGGLAQSVDLDEPERGRRVVLVAFFIGRQLVAIKAVVALAARRSARALDRA